MKLLVAAVTVLAALEAHAFSFVVKFPKPGDTQKLVLQFKDGTDLVKSDNDCVAAGCAGRYWLIRKTKGDDQKQSVSSATVRPGTFGNDTLELQLEQAVTDTTDLYLVVSDLIVVADGKPKSSGWQEYPIAPQIQQAADLGRPAIDYVSLTPHRFQNTPDERRRVTQSLVVTDPDDKTIRYNAYVTKLATGGTSESHEHTISVTGIPRGKKAKVSLAGAEQFNGKALGVGPTTIEPVSFPKGRDDAMFYVAGSSETDNLKGEKKYSVDFRLHPTWTVRSFEIGPNIEATVGNKLAKAPNSGSAAFEIRKWFADLNADAAIQTQAVVLAPKFWTDREFDNRDVGAILAWEPYLKWFEGKTLEQRRADEKEAGGIPRSIRWGFRLRPSVGIEGGRHIASSSTEVDGEQFSRLMGKATGLVQWEAWTFTTTAEIRHLFSDELLLTDDGVATTKAGDRSNLRFDLSYNLGAVALTATRINGRLPPAFTATESTSLGVSFKF
jgi:hypothetical protein